MSTPNRLSIGETQGGRERGSISTDPRDVPDKALAGQVKVVKFDGQIDSSF